MHAVALVLAASLLAANVPTGRAMPQRDYWIKAFINWDAPLIKRAGASGNAAEAMLGLSYMADVYGAHEDVPALFPPSYLGGTPAEWGARSRDGVHITMDRPHTWEAVQVWPDPEVLEPPQLVALAHGGPPATVTEIVYREDQPRIQEGSLCLWPPYPHGCTSYEYGHIALIDTDFVDLDTPWTATVTVEFYCVYKDTAGQVTGVLTSADLGLPTDTETLRMDFIPVPARSSSWGTLKATFADD